MKIEIDVLDQIAKFLEELGYNIEDYIRTCLVQQLAADLNSHDLGDLMLQKMLKDYGLDKISELVENLDVNIFGHIKKGDT